MRKLTVNSFLITLY